MIGGRDKVAWFQKDFYQNCYHKTLVLLLIAVVIMLCLIGALIYVFFEQPSIRYYASTTTGQIISMIIRH